MQPFGGRRHRSIVVNGCQCAKLANGQFPWKPACHRPILHKENFASAKDKKISLIWQIAM
jgi:hypothetical protein